MLPHALRSLCCYRLVRACLGKTAVAEHKLLFGNPLIILGVQVSLRDSGVLFWPAEDKVQKWIIRLKAILVSGVLCGGEAAKLCGALQWASQHAFNRLGRAMLRPLIRLVAALCV